MNCCQKCFKDIEIRAIIGEQTKGNCDFCNSRDVYICDITTNVSLQENFERLLDIYTPIGKLDDTFPKDKSDLIKNILEKQWSIFNLPPDKIYKFLINLLPDKYSEEPHLFDSPVGISGSINPKYLSQYSILGTNSWEDFVNEIKSNNRFHTNILNTDILKSLLQATSETFRENHPFFRARIWTNNEGFEKNEMGAPPPNKASAGRANAEGISCLYLADSEKTTLHETRAGLYDNTTVGTFILKQDIEIIDLMKIDKISPFGFNDIDIIASNLEHLKKIGDEISRPLRKHDSRLDYLPTQYICDYIKSIGYDGIKYKSTMHKTGINFAIFNQDLLECVGTVDYDINSITYDFERLTNNF